MRSFPKARLEAHGTKEERRRLLLLLPLFAWLLSGCAANYYVSGTRMGELPSSTWNFNAVLFGVRGGARTTHWSLLHDYESVSRADSSDLGGWKLKVLGPYAPTLIGAIDMNGEFGIVTPLYSQHSGNIDSVAIGPLAFPVFRLDSAEEYWRCDLLGVIHFGTPGWSIGIGSAGLSFQHEDVRPLFLEVSTDIISVEQRSAEGVRLVRTRVSSGVPDIWDEL